MSDPTADEPFGQRLKRYRQQRGMRREVLGGLVGRSGDWVKGIEQGRIDMPRLKMLLRIADVLGVDNLADLTGIEQLSRSTYTQTAHSALPAMRQALTSYDLVNDAAIDAPPSADELTRRVRHAWRFWHGPGDHRTRTAAFLPDLLTDLQHASRVLEGAERRQVLVALAQTYHLAQLYLSFQPVPELVHLTGDRAMNAAQDADDAGAIATAAWYMNHVFRDAGERHEARVDLAMQASDLLQPSEDRDHLARWGLLHLAAALSYAKIGRRNDAWRHWDRADETARALGDWTHPYLIFGRSMVDAYAITINADLLEPGKAIAIAERLDFRQMPSATRRSFHTIETARVHALNDDNVAVVHLLKRAWTESPETTRFNIFARGWVTDHVESGNGLIRDEVQTLARELDVAY